MPDWFNLTSHECDVAIDDRGFQYGDGLFETIAIRNGKPRLWSMHWQRLKRGCTVLDITPPAEPLLLDAIANAIASTPGGDRDCVAKVIVSAGAGLRGYGRGPVENAAVRVAIFPSKLPSLENYRAGIEIMVCNTRLATGSPTAGLKTLNRLEQVLARSELQGSNCFEGLTMDAEERVICGTMSNVFFVHNNSIATPPVNLCGVAGVMRRHIIESLHSNGVVVSIVELPADKLLEVDELFLANSQFGVLPVTLCDDIEIESGAVTRRVMDTMANNGIVECQL